jgi:hypothetical protein
MTFVEEGFMSGRFHVSHKLKSLVAKDQWDEYSKIGLQDFRHYVEAWFPLATLEEHNGKPVLVLAKTLPTNVSASVLPRPI